MYSLLFAYICVLFSKGSVRDRNLVLVLILYTVMFIVLQHTRILTFMDYLAAYTYATIFIIILVFLQVEEKLLTRVLLFFTIIPQAYYLYILHHPYTLSTSTPLWFLIQADNVFGWSMLAILHKQKGGWRMDLDEIDVRGYAVNVGILFSFMMF